MDLRDILQNTLRDAEFLSEPMRLYLSTHISSAYQKEYYLNPEYGMLDPFAKHILPSGESSGRNNIEQFYHDNPATRKAVQSLNPRRVIPNLEGYDPGLWGKSDWAQEHNVAYRQTARSLLAASSIGEVENIVHKSMFHQLAGMAQRRSEQTLNPSQVIQDIGTGVMEMASRLPGYNPEARGSYSSWALGLVTASRFGREQQAEIETGSYKAMSYEELSEIGQGSDYDTERGYGGEGLLAETESYLYGIEGGFATKRSVSGELVERERVPTGMRRAYLEYQVQREAEDWNAMIAASNERLGHLKREGLIQDVRGQSLGYTSGGIIPLNLYTTNAERQIGIRDRISGYQMSPWQQDDPQVNIVNVEHYRNREGQLANLPQNFYYAGRGTRGLEGSPLGNPFKAGEYGRNRAIQMYDEWLDTPGGAGARGVIGKLTERAKAGVPFTLGCSCAPNACHCDVIKRRIIEEARQGPVSAPPATMGNYGDYQRGEPAIFAKFGSIAGEGPITRHPPTFSHFATGREPIGGFSQIGVSREELLMLGGQIEPSAEIRERLQALDASYQQAMVGGHGPLRRSQANEYPSRLINIQANRLIGQFVGGEFLPEERSHPGQNYWDAIEKPGAPPMGFQEKYGSYPETLTTEEYSFWSRRADSQVKMQISEWANNFLVATLNLEKADRLEENLPYRPVFREEDLRGHRGMNYYRPLTEEQYEMVMDRRYKGDFSHPSNVPEYTQIITGYEYFPGDPEMDTADPSKAPSSYDVYSNRPRRGVWDYKQNKMVYPAEVGADEWNMGRHVAGGRYTGAIEYAQNVDRAARYQGSAVYAAGKQAVEQMESYVPPQPVGRTMSRAEQAVSEMQAMAKREYGIENVRYSKEVSSVARATREGILLGEQFFDEEKMERLAKHFGYSDTRMMREHIIAHEAGHLMVNEELKVAARGVLKNMTQDQRQAIHERMVKKFGEDHPYATDEGVAMEIAAEAYAGAKGYSVERLRSYGMEEEDIKRIVNLASESLSQEREAVPMPMEFDDEQIARISSIFNRPEPEYVTAHAQHTLMQLNAAAFDNADTWVYGDEGSKTPSRAGLRGFSRGITVGLAQWLSDPTIGQLSLSEGTSGSLQFTRGSGEVTLNQGQLESTSRILGEGYHGATQGALPSNSRALLMTLRKRMQDHINDWVKEQENQLDQAEGDPEVRATTRENISRIRSAYNKMTNALTSRIERTITDETGENLEDWKASSYTRLGSYGRLQDAMLKRPGLARQIERMGGAEAVAAGDVTYLEDQGQMFEVGSGGGGGGWGGGAGGYRGRWGGGTGSFLYSAYIAKRMMSMTFMPAVQAAQEYGQNVLDPLGRVAMGEGAIPGMASSAFGYTTRGNLLNQVIGQGAYEQFGGFQDAAYSIMGDRPGIARATSGVGLGLGMAGLGGMVGQMGSMMGLSETGSKAVGSTLTKLGIVTAVGTLALEGWNALFGTDYSLGGIAESTAGNFSYERSRAKILHDRNAGRPWTGTGDFLKQWGYQSATIGLGMVGMDRADMPRWAQQAAGYGPSGDEVTEEEIMAGMTDAERAVYQNWKTPEPQVYKDLTNMATRLQSVTGEEVANISGAMRGFGRNLKLTDDAGAIPENIQGIISKIIESGAQNQYTSEESQKRFSTAYEQFGYRRDSKQGLAFAEYYAGLSDKEKASVEMMGGQVARFAGGVSGYYADTRQANRDMTTYGIRTQPQAQVFQSALATATTYMGGTAEDYSGLAGYMSQNLTQYQGAAISGIASTMAQANMDPTAVMAVMSGLGMSNADLGLAGRMVGGDMSAWSYASRQAGTHANRWLSRTGAPVYESSLGEFRQLMAGQYAQGNPYGAGNVDFALQYEDEEAQQAWEVGGADLRDRLHRRRMWGFQQKSWDLGQQQLDTAREYTYQQWGYQDQQRDMAYQSQMANFASQEQRMVMQNQFATRQEDISLQRINLREQFGGWQSMISAERMQLQHENQLWNLGWQRNASQLQQGWQREDWQYQDTVTNLQQGWQLEDVNEAIRRSSGYERRQLIERRNRMTTMQSLEGEQTDTVRERQEQMWALEDERFQHQEEYIRKLMDLDIEQFNLNEEQRKRLLELDKEQWELNKEQRETFYEFEQKELQRHRKEYEEQFELQQQIIDAEREYQEKQMEFRQAEFELQKEMTEETHSYQESLTEIKQQYKDLSGYWQEMMKNDPTAMINNFKNMLTTLATIDTNTITGMRSLFSEMQGISQSSINAILDLLAELDQ